ncbi:coiled-coil domain-containing protein 50 isoform X3 [Scophthalmus maximus]|nr:coiled-coil domain-containing protein 50 isoform X3 [Scophthalmus maximus]
MKEEKRRQKQKEANFEEDYFEDHGAARRPLDLDKHTRHRSTSPGQYDAYAPVSSHRDHSPDYSSTEPKRSRYPRQDPAAPHSRSRYPEHASVAEGGRSRHADPYPEHLLPSRGKHGEKYQENEPTETGRARGSAGEDPERVLKRQDRPTRPPPPHIHIEKDKALDRGRDRRRDRDRGRDLDWEKHMGKDHRRGREQDLRGTRAGGRDGERSRDRGQSGDRHRERDTQRQKDRARARTRSRERGLDQDPLEQGQRRDWSREGRASWLEEEDDGERERRAKGRQRVQSGPEEVFDEPRSDEGRGDTREFWDPRHGEGPSGERIHSHPSGETGRIVHRGSGAVIAETEYELSEATKGLTKLDLREQELKDMEVARKLQEDEINVGRETRQASKMQTRAAQVAQDEEIARLLMEQEKKEYKKNREREKEKERERERMAMERRRPEGDSRPNSEEVVRPRTREEYEYQRQRNHNKPARPPQPRAHDYENVNPGYGYPDHPAPPRAPTRPEAAYKAPRGAKRAAL